MLQITVRGFDEALRNRLTHLAQQEGISLNQAALRLLRKGSGLPDHSGKEETVGKSLDHLIGSWTQTEAEEFDAAIEDFSSIDEAAWK